MSNHGNFLALLQFRIQVGDHVLEKHLKTAAGNTLYTSKGIQNELINICGDLIRENILRKIREVVFFTVIADEATDASNDEQLAISIRFLDDGISSESFLGFIECLSGVSGEAIADNILGKLAEWTLNCLGGSHMMVQELWLVSPEVLHLVSHQSTPKQYMHIVHHINSL